LKGELSQYRELQAFAQFGSDLDADTKRTLARGERLVKTLNQGERNPVPVEEQVVQIYAATNGFLDRIAVDKVEKFLVELSERVRGGQADLLKQLADGQWDGDVEARIKAAVKQFADDFGYDLDEEGLPLADSVTVATRS
jgi:F-type H+-transporting ATPase subunit alpha